MANVLGSSNDNLQAPPPPPLPNGMKVAGNAAPPPPPLPAGLNVAGAQASPPPAPPIPPTPPAPPAAPKAAPAPPPLPAGLSMGAPAPSVSKELTGGSGRTSMSLADAEKEKEKEEEEARIEAAKPKAKANGGDLKEGEKCFARSGMDGLYYYATVESIGSEKAKVKFFDDVEGELLFSKIYTVDEAVKEMQCFANYSGRGNYFPAVIDSKTEDKASVHYDENPSLKETLDYSNIRFAIR